MSLEFHTLKPSSLVDATASPQVNFDNLWARASFHDDSLAHSWRGHWLLPEDDGLVFKAQRSPHGRTIVQRTDRAFRQLREIHGLLSFRSAGAPIPAIIAWGVERRAGIPIRTLLLEQRIQGAQDLAVFLENETDPMLREQALASVGAAVQKLHQLALFHRNLATRNILLLPTQNGLKVWFIDCPRAAPNAASWRHQGLARADRTFLARHAARDGLRANELALLLSACGEEQIDPALRYIEQRKPGRNFSRADLWLWSGR